MVNKRNATIDVARGIAVLIMPSIHAVLMYGKLDVQQGALGSVLGFLAENIAAPVFMLSMGASIAVGKPKPLRQIFIRTASLLAMGYLLNFLKFVLPMLLHAMPDSFLLENHISYDVYGMVRLFAMGDILQFASIGYLACSLVFRLQRYPMWALVMAIGVIVSSPYFWDKAGYEKPFWMISGLFNGQPPIAFFPFFPWAAYPLTGLLLGYFLVRRRASGLYVPLFLVGCCLITIGILTWSLEPIAWEIDFYRLGPSGTLLHLGAVLVWLCICHLTVGILKNSKVFSFLTWLSKHITFFYMVQWIVVFWFLPITGYRQLGLLGSLVAMVSTTILTLIIVRAMSGYLGLRFQKGQYSNSFIAN